LNPKRGFASIAHIPALHALSDFEIAAVCTTGQESADTAARHFGIPLAFSNPEDLARHSPAPSIWPLGRACGHRDHRARRV
jgi:predicted dehydrogenase